MATAQTRDVRVITAEAAKTAGWIGKPVNHTFGAGREGSDLVSSLMTEARHQGAIAISDISITLTSPGESGPAECRTSILPETVSETHYTPPSSRQVSVEKPVTRLVTEQQNRCHPENHLESRPVTEYVQRCHLASRPVTRTRTTMSFQYDSFTHSSRSVPRTETYTAYESRQECRSEPVFRTRMESVMKNVCRLEPVSHLVTRYEFQLQTQYVPPKVETLRHNRLRESEPTCYLIDPPSDPKPARAEDAPGDTPPAPLADPANRIEAVFYFPPPPTP